MQWWEDYFADVDTMDSARYGRWFAEGIVLQFNNAPPISGKQAVLGFLSSFTRDFTGLRHSHGQIVGNEDSGAGEAVIAFTRNDQAELAVRGVTMVAREQGLFTRMAIYADFSSLYSLEVDAG